LIFERGRGFYFDVNVVKSIGTQFFKYLVNQKHFKQISKIEFNIIWSYLQMYMFSSILGLQVPNLAALVGIIFGAKNVSAFVSIIFFELT